MQSGHERPQSQPRTVSPPKPHFWGLPAHFHLYQHHQIAGMRWLDPYYAANTLLLVVHLLLRFYFVQFTPDGSRYSRVHTLNDFYTWEKQALATMVAVVAWKALRRRSWDHCAQNVFFWGKVITGLTALLVDVRLAVWYCLGAWGVYVAFPQPMIQMQLASSKVRVLTPASMKEAERVLSEGNWLVYYYTEPHDESVAMAPAFLELAEHYGGERLRFGCLDVCLWPRFAGSELKLSASTWGSQLPAVVMYRGGKEVGRLPAASQVEDQWGYRRNYFTKRDVIKKFQLDSGGVADGKGSKAAAAAAGGAAGSKQRKG